MITYMLVICHLLSPMCMSVAADATAAAAAASSWDANTGRKCRYESRTRSVASTRCFCVILRFIMHNHNDVYLLFTCISAIIVLGIFLV